MFWINLDRKLWLAFILIIIKTLQPNRYGPRGQPVPFTLAKKDFDLSVLEWRPTTAGHFRVDFESRCDQRPITNSPCFVTVYDAEQVAKLVKPSRLVVGADNFIQVDFGKLGNQLLANHLMWSAINRDPITIYNFFPYPILRLELNIWLIILLFFLQKKFVYKNK